jgi:ABC-type branched-subunit amino acid transport system substrate-binding protein
LRGPVQFVDVSADFEARLDATDSAAADPLQGDYQYAAETYDSIVLVALAAEEAGSDGSVLAEHIVGLTKDGEKCTDFDSCVAIMDAGGDADYDGVSGPIPMNGDGDLLEASYGIFEFGQGNRLDGNLTVFVSTRSPTPEEPLSPVEVDRAGDGTLRIGSILPVTGSLAYLGPQTFAAAELAVADVNAAGGVFGNPVEFVRGDSGDTTTDIAAQTVDGLLADGVDVIVGAMSSSVTLSVIDTVTAAGVVLISPANTSLALSGYADRGLYFRVAPADDVQGVAIAEAIADDGAGSVYVLAADGLEGPRILDVLTAELEAKAIDVVGLIYDPSAETFEAEVAAIVAADPDAIVIVGFSETSRILREMVDNDIGPGNKLVYGVDSNIVPSLGVDFDAGV